MSEFGPTLIERVTTPAVEFFGRVGAAAVDAFASSPALAESRSAEWEARKREQEETLRRIDAIGAASVRVNVDRRFL